METEGLQYEKCHISVKENDVYVTRAFNKVRAGNHVRLLDGTDLNNVSVFPPMRFTIHKKTEFEHATAGRIEGVTQCRVEHNTMVLSKGSTTHYVNAAQAIFKSEMMLMFESDVNLVLVTETTAAIKVSGLNTIFLSNPSTVNSMFNIENDTDEELRNLMVNWSGVDEVGGQQVYYERSMTASTSGLSEADMHKPGLRFQTSGVPPRSSKSFPFKRSDVAMRLVYAMLIDEFTRDKTDASTDVFLDIAQAPESFGMIPGMIQVTHTGELVAEGHINRHYGKELVPCGKNKWVTQTVSVQTQYDGRTAIGAKFKFLIKNSLPNPVKVMVIRKDNIVTIEKFGIYEGTHEIKF